MTDKQIAQFVINNGKTYKPAILPADIDRGNPGDCFDWVALQVTRHPEYKYVEGLANTPNDPSYYTLHAWLTDGEHAFDPTWMATDGDGVERAVPAHYIGIEIDINDVIRFLKVTGYKSLIANGHRAPELWHDIMGRTIGKMGLLKNTRKIEGYKPTLMIMDEYHD